MLTPKDISCLTYCLNLKAVTLKITSPYMSLQKMNRWYLSKVWDISQFVNTKKPWGLDEDMKDQEAREKREERVLAFEKKHIWLTVAVNGDKTCRSVDYNQSWGKSLPSASDHLLLGRRIPRPRLPHALILFFDSFCLVPPLKSSIMTVRTCSSEPCTHNRCPLF